MQNNKNNADINEDDVLVVIIDPEKTIRYASDDFCRVIGHSADDLTGQSVKLVIHPDMPSAPIGQLWKSALSGNPWMGMLSFRTKTGNELWLDTYVIPTLDNGEVSELQCIYRKPSAAVTKRTQDIYRSRLRGKTPAALKRTPLKFSYQLILANLLCLSPVLVFLLWQAYSLPALLVCAATLIGSIGCNIMLTQRFQKLVSSSKKIVNSRPKQLVYTGYTDDISQLELALTMLQSQLDSILKRVINSSSQVFNSSESSAAIMASTCGNISDQQRDLEQIAVAVEEMAATTGVMTDNTRSALEQVKKAQSDATEGTSVVDKSIREIRNLDQAIDQIGNHLQRLIQRNSKIDKVAEVIQDIAEKTNLLALNAAIEAARAGENGRGFAVVADEVRQLAQRTRTSTDEISEIILGVQNETNSITTSMKQGRDIADQTVKSIEEAGNSLLAIINAVNSISDMTNQIAVATEQQNSATLEVNERIHTISDAVTEVAAQAQNTLQMNQQTAALSLRQIRIVELLTKA
ncbi:MAG: methyl-accepting chemotaxis protein [Amphritea sp.]